MNREDLTYFLFVNSKLNELLYREDLQKLAEEDNPIVILIVILMELFLVVRANCVN